MEKIYMEIYNIDYSIELEHIEGSHFDLIIEDTWNCRTVHSDEVCFKEGQTLAELVKEIVQHWVDN